MDYLKKLDAFPKTLDDFRVKTNLGGLLSIISLSLMFVLFCSEYYFHFKTVFLTLSTPPHTPFTIYSPFLYKTFYFKISFLSYINYFYVYSLNKEIVDHLYVNTTRSEKLDISFDISFPVVPCKLLSVDVFDETGEQQLDIGHSIYKHKLSPDGIALEHPTVMNIGGTLKSGELFFCLTFQYNIILVSLMLFRKGIRVIDRRCAYTFSHWYSRTRIEVRKLLRSWNTR
jgi:hypothetical protein